MSDTGITTAVLKGANAPRTADLAQDDLEEAQGYRGLPNCPVTREVCGPEVVRGLPGNLQTSPHN